MLLALLLLCVQQQFVSAAVGGRGGGFGGGGGSRAFSPASRPFAYRPATTPPQSATMASRPAAPSGRAYGSTPLPGGYSTYARPGFRSSPLIFPLTAGLLAGAAVSTLARDPTAYCDGRRLQCYENACRAALNAQCPEAAAGGNATLVLTACPPGSRYSECYQTQSFSNSTAASFECFGVRRPKYGREDVSGVCHQPGNNLTSSGGVGSGVLAQVGGLLGGLLVCGHAMRFRRHTTWRYKLTCCDCTDGIPLVLLRCCLFCLLLAQVLKLVLPLTVTVLVLFVL